MIDEGFRAGLVVTAFGFGLRHGVDWDHVAAITDIASSRRDGRSSMRLATLYALGHAAVVLVLGSVAILLGDRLPGGIDRVMERVVGVTLLALGVYVVVSLPRQGRDFRLRSRWMLVLSGLRRVLTRRRRDDEVVVEHEHAHVHGPPGHGHDHGVAGGGGEGDAAVLVQHRHRHVHHGRMPDDPFASYRPRTAVAVGMLHGVGAETATQVLVFLAAARAGLGATGLLLLGVFVAGLLVSNTAIAAAATVGFLNAGRSFRIYATVAVVTAVFSLTVGSLFVLGRSDLLPAFVG